MSREVIMAGVEKRDHSRQCWRWIVVVLELVSLGGTQGIIFDVHERECVGHETSAGSGFVQMFVEVVNPGRFRQMGIDIVIQAPGGEYIHTEKVKYESIRDEKARRGAHINTMASYEASINFTAVEKGLYNICFHNRGNVAETVKFEIIHRESGVADHQEPARDVHVQSLMEHIASLSDAVVDVEFEQDWLASHMDRHAWILEKLSRRVVYKAVLEVVAFFVCGVIQVALCQRLLRKHLAVNALKNNALKNNVEGNLI